MCLFIPCGCVIPLYGDGNLLLGSIFSPLGVWSAGEIAKLLVFMCDIFILLIYNASN